VQKENENTVSKVFQAVSQRSVIKVLSIVENQAVLNASRTLGIATDIIVMNVHLDNVANYSSKLPIAY